MQTRTVAEPVFVITGWEQDCDYSAPNLTLHFHHTPQFMREDGETDPDELFLFPLGVGGKDVCSGEHEKACAATATQVQILWVDTALCSAEPAVWHLPQAFFNWNYCCKLLS